MLVKQHLQARYVIHHKLEGCGYITVSGSQSRFVKMKPQRKIVDLSHNMAAALRRENRFTRGIVLAFKRKPLVASSAWEAPAGKGWLSGFPRH